MGQPEKIKTRIAKLIKDHCIEIHWVKLTYLWEGTIRVYGTWSGGQYWAATKIEYYFSLQYGTVYQHEPSIETYCQEKLSIPNKRPIQSEKENPKWWYVWLESCVTILRWW